MRCLTILLAISTMAPGFAGEPKSVFPGPGEKGFLLPNGWTLSPVGRHAVINDLPLNIIALKDGRHALVATSGFNDHDLLLVNLEGEPRVVGRVTTRQSWFGLATNPQETKIWQSGGGQPLLHAFDLRDGTLTRTGPAEPPPAKRGTATPPEQSSVFKSGLCLDSKAGILYSLDINHQEKPGGSNEGRIHAIQLNDQSERVATIGGRPYDVVVGPGGHQLFVSDWAGQRVLVLDPASLRVEKKITVGEHPNQMVLDSKRKLLYVACATANAVSVIDTERGLVIETINTSLFPKAPAGSTPDALALTPSGDTLYVANADNNCLAVVDVSRTRQSQVRGFVPTGWYPTSVAVTPDGKKILVGVGKGLQSKPNPIQKEKPAPTPGETDSRRGIMFPFIGTTMNGALSVIPTPDEAGLRDWTAMVYRNCPYSDDLLTVAPHPEKTAIPNRVGDPSPIKYVLYIIKENRTYDQVFGDLAAGKNPKGNGDPSLCMFPRRITPHHHKLAEEFVLLDNLYCNGQVSADGHPWSTMAYNTDHVARDWHLTYSARKGVADDDDGDLQNAPAGYLWDACKRKGISYRSYGEYGKRVSDGRGGFKMEGRVPGLVGHVCPDYGLANGREGEKVRDTDRAATFLAEYDRFAKAGTMPRFIVMSLGEDHTEGSKVGAFTPQACVASNDLALGRIVEHISHGPLWNETAIFVIEDDAQNGPDHVDAHRTVGFVISPYTKRGHVDSTQYATVSLIRTMELILGLSPLSQYDAAARPMFRSFTAKADPTPYKHLPAEIDLGARNDKTAYGAERSNKMDFSEYDKINDFELNEILWHVVMGRDAPEPPAVRRAIAFRPQPAKR